MLRNSSVLMLTICSALFPAVLASQSVAIQPKSVSAVYDSQNESTTSLSVTSKMPNGTPELAYYLTVDPSSSSRVFSSAQGISSLSYQVYDAAAAPRNIVMSSSEAVSSADVFSNAFSGTNKQRRSVDSLYFTVLPGGFASAGTYSASFVVNLYSGVFGTGVWAASATVAATLTVAAILDLSVVPVGAPFDYSAVSAVFDYGTIESGAAVSADLIARANTTYGVTISSLNGGRLKNTDAADSSEIPYSLTADGASIALSAGIPVQLASGASATTEEGRRYRLETTILDFDFPSDGTYTDTLTLAIVQN